LVINATSASLSGAEIPIHPERLAHTDLVMDMMYGDKPTPFMTQAIQAGAKTVVDGLGMLVEQAAEAFYLWRGVRPETASVLSDLRIQLGQVSPRS
jgi:shikimate dehydrogenase